MTSTVLLTLLAVMVVFYTMRRRARVTRDDLD